MEYKEYKEQRKGEDSKEYYYPNLIARIKEKGMNISKLSKAINMNYYLLTRKLNNNRKISIKEAKAICKVLDSSFEELFFSPYEE